MEVSGAADVAVPDGWRVRGGFDRKSLVEAMLENGRDGAVADRPDGVAPAGSCFEARDAVAFAKPDDAEAREAFFMSKVACGFTGASKR